MVAVNPSSRPFVKRENRKFDFNRPFLVSQTGRVFQCKLHGMPSTYPLHMSAMLEEVKLAPHQTNPGGRKETKKQRERAASRGYLGNNVLPAARDLF
jgi:hypothetical protein